MGSSRCYRYSVDYYVYYKLIIVIVPPADSKKTVYPPTINPPIAHKPPNNNPLITHPPTNIVQQYSSTWYVYTSVGEYIHTHNVLPSAWCKQRLPGRY